VTVHPGDEYLVALGMLRAILDENLAPGLQGDWRASLSSMTAQWPPAKVSERTGIEEDIIRKIARLFAAAKAPLALAEGLSISSPNALEAAVAANLLCTVSSGSLPTIDFASKSAYSQAAPASEIKEITERMKHGEVDLLLIHDVNPAFNLPLAWDFAKGMEFVPMVASFSSFLDETSSMAHLLLPTHTPLESWGDYSPREGVMDLMQPTMGNIFQTRHIGDVLLATGRALAGRERFPWDDFHQVLLASWKERWKTSARDVPFDVFWQNALMRGGVWDRNGLSGFQPSAGQPVQFAFPESERSEKSATSFG
jgi:anaerobic selenocysteine-containing dehydrogenase